MLALLNPVYVSELIRIELSVNSLLEQLGVTDDRLKRSAELVAKQGDYLAGRAPNGIGERPGFLLAHFERIDHLFRGGEIAGEGEVALPGIAPDPTWPVRRPRYAGAGLSYGERMGHGYFRKLLDIRLCNSGACRHEQCRFGDCRGAGEV